MSKTTTHPKTLLSAEGLEALASDTASYEAFGQSVLQSALFAAAEQIKSKCESTTSVDLDCRINLTFVPGLTSIGGECVKIWFRIWHGSPPPPGPDEPVDSSRGYWSRPYPYTKCPTSKAN